MKKYTFSGHETFSCKNLWLKKGCDYIQSSNKFNDPKAVIELGVGKNMVSSIKYWCKAVGVLNDDVLTDFGKSMFSDEGYDPFIEDIGTIWLLHYYLVKNEIASIFSLVFVSMHKERNIFTKDQLFRFLKRKAIENRQEKTFNEKTVNTDINVLLRSYKISNAKNLTVEDFSALFLDLNLIDCNENEAYYFNYAEKKSLPNDILLYCLLDYFDGEKVISFNQLLDLALIFCMTPNELSSRLEEISSNSNNSYFVFTEDAGIKQIQLKGEVDKNDLLNQYYSR